MSNTTALGCHLPFPASKQLWSLTGLWDNYSLVQWHFTPFCTPTRPCSHSQLKKRERTTRTKQKHTPGDMMELHALLSSARFHMLSHFCLCGLESRETSLVVLLSHGDVCLSDPGKPCLLYLALIRVFH